MALGAASAVMMLIAVSIVVIPYVRSELRQKAQS
jgi:hypothetical protein